MNKNQINQDKMRQLRLASQKEQKEVAFEVGISELSYKRYEHGLREPKVSVAMCIAAALNTSVENLWGRDNSSAN